MQKEIKVIDEQRKIMQITTVDERWYCRPIMSQKTGLPEYEFVPSSTWIASHYPKGIAFYKWLADKGWNEAEAIKIAAGNKGSKVHKSIELLENNGSLAIDTLILNNQTNVPEMLSTEELTCIQSFATWHEEVKPELLATEMTVFGEGYAGTLDRIYRINGQIYIVDFKTSQQIWEEYKLQVSSYNYAEIDIEALNISKEEWDKRKMAILQVGYRLNKKGFKFTEIEDKYKLFLMAKEIWANENSNAKPLQRDFPLVIKLNKGESNGKHDTRTNEGMVKEAQQMGQSN